VIENRSGQAVDSVDVAFYLSSDFELDAADELLASSTLMDLLPGSFSMASAELALPEDSGGEAFMTVIAVVDPSNAIEETDELNNTWQRDLFIGQGEQANLMAWPMIMFDPQQDSVDWGQSVSVETVVHNGSNVTTGAFDVGYYLSADETLDAGDTLLATEEISSGLTPFAQYFQTVQITMPSSNPGGSDQEWFIMSKADDGDAVAEFDEIDNVGWSPIFVGSKPADLVGWMDITSETDVLWGQAVSLTGQIENVGGSNVDTPFDVAYYLTSDPEIDSSDVLLATQTVGSLAANSSTAVLSSVTLPSDQGQFGDQTVFIVAVIDSTDAVAEVDEWNNFMGDWLSTDVAAADLVALHVEPEFFNPFWNEQMNVSFAMANMGNLDAENFQVSFYLNSLDGMLEQAYQFSGASESLDIPLLQAGMDYNGTVTLTMPDPAQVDFVQAGQEDGTHMLMMKVDSGEIIDEIVEMNNVFMMPIRLEMQRGMIEITDSVNDPFDFMIDIGPVLEGEAITESFTISNQGMGVLNINGVSVDSASFELTQAGAPVGIESMFEIAAGQSLSFDVTMSASQQGFHEGQIQVFSDDAGMETAYLSVWADVISSPVDLAIDSITTPRSANWGDTIDLNIRISNQQAGDAENSLLEVMLTDNADPFAGGMMMPLASQQIEMISGGTNTTETVTVTLP